MEDNIQEKLKPLILFFEVANKGFEMLDIVRGDSFEQNEGEKGMRKLHKTMLEELKKECVDIAKIDSLLLQMEIRATINKANEFIIPNGR